MNTASAQPTHVVPGPVHFVQPALAQPSRPVAGPDHPLAIASLGRRVGAYVLDVGLLVVGGGLLVAAIDAALGLTEISGRADGSVAATLAGLAYVVLVSLVQFAYFASPILRPAGGQTLGKRALGIRFVRKDGSAATAGLALRRASALIGPSAVVGTIMTLAGSSAAFVPVVVLAFLLLIVYPVADFVIAPLVGVGRQTIHDRMAGTVVVDAGITAPDPSAVPAPITGRARTGATWAFAGGATAVIVVVVLLIAALAAIGARVAESEGTLPDTYDLPYTYSSYDAAPADC